MKRFLVRLLALSVVVVLGLYAIAQAQRAAERSGDSARKSSKKKPAVSEGAPAAIQSEATRTSKENKKDSRESSNPFAKRDRSARQEPDDEPAADDGYASDDLETLDDGGDSATAMAGDEEASDENPRDRKTRDDRRASDEDGSAMASDDKPDRRARRRGSRGDESTEDEGSDDELPSRRSRRDRDADETSAMASDDGAMARDDVAFAGDESDGSDNRDADSDQGARSERSATDDEPALLGVGDDVDEPTGTPGTGRPGGKHLEGPQSPALTLEKTAPAEIQVGKPATFEIRVRNVGTVPAQDVEIRDEVPQGARLLGTNPPASQSAEGEIVFSLGTMKPGDETTVQLELMPTEEGEIGSVARLHFASEVSVRTVATRPELVLEVSAPREVLIGDDVTFSIKISNPGTGMANDVVLSETVPEYLEHPAGAELEYPVGNLKPKETRELELTMKAVKAGTVINLLQARAPGNLQARQESQFDVLAPALEVTMEGPKRRYLERQATYTMIVSNPGTAVAKGVSLVTYLPEGLKFMNANNSGQYDAQTRTVQWLLDELPPNESGQVTLTAMPIEAGEHTLRVEGTADKGLSDEMEEEILVEGVAAILFQVADVADPIEINGETTYEIRVVNQGSKAATNVQLVAVLPGELKALSAEGPTRHVLDGQQVRFQELSRLAPKADTTYRIRVQAVEAGDARIRVQLLTDEMKAPVTKEESTQIYADE